MNYLFIFINIIKKYKIYHTIFYYHVIFLVSHYGGAFEQQGENKWMNKAGLVYAFSLPKEDITSTWLHLPSPPFSLWFSLASFCSLSLPSSSFFFFFSFKIYFWCFYFSVSYFLSILCEANFQSLFSLGPKIVSGFFCGILV